MKDIDPNDIKEILKSLCEKNILVATQGNGTDSFLFTKNDKTEKETETDEDNEDNNDEEEYIKVANTSTQSENLLEAEIKSFGRFNNFKVLTTQIANLKEFIAYKFNRNTDDTANAVNKRLKEEIAFLKEELKGYRNLISEILECQRRNQSPKTNKKISETATTQYEWKEVKKGPSRFKEPSNDEIATDFYKNKFNSLIIDNTFNRHGTTSPDLLTTAKENNENNQLRSNQTTLSSKNCAVSNITIRRRPNPVINPFPERDLASRRSTSEDTPRFIQKKKKIRVITDSIPKGIRTREFNNNLKHGDARFKNFPGATITNLAHYSIPTLINENPDVVLMHVGINDILNMERTQVSEMQIANKIIKIVNDYKKHGVEKVFVSGIAFCARVDQNRINTVNDILYRKADSNNYIFINNSMITKDDLWRDKLHLNEDGKISLANNYLGYLNHFL